MRADIAGAKVLKIALYEGQGSQSLAGAERAELLAALLAKGYPVACVREPGGSAGGVPGGVAAGGRLLVLGRFDDETPRQALDAEKDVLVSFRNINGSSASQIVETVDAVRDEMSVPRPGGWKPWFPVIDYGRCTNCMQCLSFCLFDVYGVSTAGQITVQKAHNCKTDCPACSRVCPEVAILFPKYRAGPINGDEVREEDLQREKMKVDISALLGGDIYAALRQRSEHARSRFAKERDDKRAIEERKRCLAKLQKELDIPEGLLESLPSPEQIRSKAEAARAQG